MQKLQQNISYQLAKTSFGIYLVSEIRTQGGKELPTETDIKKTLLRINPACTAAQLQTARQISRYCQTSKNYLRDAREETLDKVAQAINAPIKSLAHFREKANPLLKSFKYYKSYVSQAEQYLGTLVEEAAGDGKKFCELFGCNGQTATYLSMISYHFGAVDKELPAVSFGAESDLCTERIIRGLFEEFEQQAPQYLPEDAFFTQLQSPAAQMVFIAVGLFGNRLTTWMGEHGRLPQQLQILPSQKCIVLQGDEYYANRSAGVDFAIFCRVVLNNSTVFIIGGIEGFGTQRLGEYLQNGWPQLHSQLAYGQCDVLLYKTTSSHVGLVKHLYV